MARHARRPEGHVDTDDGRLAVPGLGLAIAGASSVALWAIIAGIVLAL